MRVRCLWIGILAAFLAPAVPARAANQTVTATASNEFTPAAVTVLQGESVTWTNSGGFHNVRFDDGSFTQPGMPEPAPWTVTVARSFNNVGTFRYECEAHAPGMSGTVTVQAPGTTPVPGPAGPQPVSADKTAPGLKLGGQPTQRVLRQRAVRVRVEVDEGSTVVASGTVAVPGAAKVLRLKKATRHLAARAKATLKLRLSKQTLRALRRAFAKRPRLTARVTVTARDSAGNVSSAKRKVRLKG